MTVANEASEGEVLGRFVREEMEAQKAVDRAIADARPDLSRYQRALALAGEASELDRKAKELAELLDGTRKLARERRDEALAAFSSELPADGGEEKDTGVIPVHAANGTPVVPTPGEKDTRVVSPAEEAHAGSSPGEADDAEVILPEPGKTYTPQQLRIPPEVVRSRYLEPSLLSLTPSRLSETVYIQGRAYGVIRKQRLGEWYRAWLVRLNDPGKYGAAGARPLTWSDLKDAHPGVPDDELPLKHLAVIDEEERAWLVAGEPFVVEDRPADWGEPPPVRSKDLSYLSTLTVGEAEQFRNDLESTPEPPEEGATPLDEPEAKQAERANQAEQAMSAPGYAPAGAQRIAIPRDAGVDALVLVALDGQGKFRGGREWTIRGDEDGGGRMLRAPEESSTPHTNRAEAVREQLIEIGRELQQWTDRHAGVPGVRDRMSKAALAIAAAMGHIEKNGKGEGKSKPKPVSKGPPSGDWKEKACDAHQALGVPKKKAKPPREEADGYRGNPAIRRRTRQELPAALRGLMDDPNVNDHGVYDRAERVPIPIPKSTGCSAAVKVAPRNDGMWAAGHDLEMPASGGSHSPASVSREAFETRELAIAETCEMFLDELRRNKRAAAAKAVEAYLEKLWPANEHGLPQRAGPGVAKTKAGNPVPEQPPGQKQTWYQWANSVAKVLGREVEPKYPVLDLYKSGAKPGQAAKQLRCASGFPGERDEHSTADPAAVRNAETRPTVKGERPLTFGQWFATVKGIVDGEVNPDDALWMTWFKQGKRPSAARDLARNMLGMIVVAPAAGARKKGGARAR